MAATFTLRLRTDHALAALRKLGDRAPQAIARSLNRATVSARTLLVRDMAKDLGLRQADVTSQVITREARPDKLSATVEASGARISLIRFGARQLKRSGVRAKLPAPGKGRYPDAFIATGRNGNQHVFARTGRARFPIARLDGPSLPHVFTKHRPAAIARGEDQLVKNLEHEFKFAMQQAATK